MKEKFFALKAACLLHDPPTKAWDIVKRRNHEERARKIAEDILRGSRLEYAKDLLGDVKQADRLAAGVDRWLLSKLVGEDYSSFRCDEVRIKNIFNPKFSTSVKELNEEQVSVFAEQLNRILRAIQDENLAYHVLFACYEPSWVVNDLPACPADTRAPSHNIFDHNYATASMMNWLMDKKEPRGILLRIDLGGPQRFISSSRKLRDLWVSSYLVSALAWKLFWLFIKTLGPDVMVLPTCRGNPFYYHSLISVLRQKVNKEVIDRLKKLVKEITENCYDPDEHIIPTYAVVPVTATFMLPDLDVLRQFDEFKNITGIEDLKELIRRKYEETWSKVYEKVIEKCKELEEDFGELAGKAADLLENCKRYDFHKVPPLPLRVIAAHTNDLYDLGFQRDEKERYRLYHYMFKFLACREDKNKIYKYRPEEGLKLYDMTNDLLSKSLESWLTRKNDINDKGFSYCSICGYLPAIVIMPREEEFEVIGLSRNVIPIFGGGERLCPYCLIKRLLSLGEVLKSAVDELLGETSDVPNLRFPPVCDVAVLPFKKSLIEIGIELGKYHPDLADALSEKIDTILKRLPKRRIPVRCEQPIMYVEKKLLEKIGSVKIDHLRKNLKELLYLDSESGIMKSYEVEGCLYYNPRRDWQKIRDIMSKDRRAKLFGKVEGLNTYYATVRGDADNFGKIIQGKVEEGFGIKIEDYLCNLLDGDTKEVVQAMIDGRYKDVRELCEKNRVSEIDKKIDEMRKIIEELKTKKEIVVSPSYHSALSRALMNNAFRDVRNIEEYCGLAVYAGGDDLLAVMPVDKCLDAIKKLREDFSFPSEPRGFYKIRNYYIPSLATASRSFSAYLGHYMFPMYIIMSRSMELLDGLAKEARWMLYGEEKRRKDALVLSYCPRGGEQSALLSLTNIRDHEKKLGTDVVMVRNFVELVEKGEFSSRLIYDLNSLESVEFLVEKEDLLKKIVENVFYRKCEITNEEEKREKAAKNAEKFLENYDLILEVNDERHLYLKELALSLKLYLSALREVA